MQWHRTPLRMLPLERDVPDENVPLHARFGHAVLFVRMIENCCLGY